MPAFGCVHAYVLLSVCAVKKVQELSAAKCAFLPGIKMLPFYTDTLFFHCFKAFGLLLYVIYMITVITVSVVCLNLNVE